MMNRSEGWCEMAGTYDSAALGILLAPGSDRVRKARLAAMAKHAHQALGQECPECGGTEIEDNGAGGSQLVNLCTGCGHQWGPE